MLLPSPTDVGTPLDDVQWAAVLRSAIASEDHLGFWASYHCSVERFSEIKGEHLLLASRVVARVLQTFQLISQLILFGRSHHHH